MVPRLGVDPDHVAILEERDRAANALAPANARQDFGAVALVVAFKKFHHLAPILGKLVELCQ